MFDLQAVDAATDSVTFQGIRVFNGALFGATEEEHVAVLLHAMTPPPGAMIVDAGCGIGEVSRLMRLMRPDLNPVLLNVSAHQLDLCPQDMDLVLGDFDAMPIAAGTADVVMFNYAICHSENWPRTLAEARRVLKPGGILFISDMARMAGDNLAFSTVLGAEAHAPEQVEAWARGAGFKLDFAIAPEVVTHRLRGLLEQGSNPKWPALLDDVVSTIWRFIALDPIEAAFNRHEKVAFQFSGGRDSTAALYMLRPYWDRMTVYHLDTGDQFPETRAVVAEVSRDVPLTIIHTDVRAVRLEHGMPTDLLPVDNTALGRMVSGETLLLQSRYDCCARALMTPMHQRMRDDGVTLLVRGQRDDEYAEPPLRSGDHNDGYEVLYPIQDWTGEQVSAYLKDNNLPIAPFYEQGARRAPECMGCTAWWDEGRAAFMKEHHPAEYEALQGSLRRVKAAIGKQMAWLDNELGD